MSSSETGAGELLVGLRLAAERALSAFGAGRWKPQEAKLPVLLLAAPFAISAMVSQAAASVLGLAAAVAAVCAVFAVSWLLAVLAMEGVRRGTLVAVSVPLFALVVGGSAGVLGGFGAPAACMLLALPIETYEVTRSRPRALIAFALGVAAVAGVSFADPAPLLAASPWHWLSPVVYAALLAFRWQVRAAGAPKVEGAAPRGLDATQLDGAVLRLSRAGEVEEIGGAGEGMFNVQPELLLGTGLFERIHVADRVAFLCAVDEVLREGETRTVELRIRRAANAETGDQGGYGLYLLELVQCVDEQPSVWVLARDASSLACLRSELARAVEQAEATEVAKGRFLATVSHELRTPLNAIIGFSEMLLHKEISGELSSKQSEHVSMIREAGNHLLSVVNAILDVSKIESGSYHVAIEPFELKRVVELSCAMLEPQATAKAVSVTTKIPAGLDLVQGDQRALQQIMLNLVSNAIKFTPEGGSVTVNAVQGEGTLRLFVNDTGIGIAADDLEKIGRPFMQVHNDYTRQFQGTGLGLSLVKGLVGLLGGTMSIESAPGLGTTVMIGLPTARRGDDELAADQEWNRQGEGNGTALRRIA